MVTFVVPSANISLRIMSLLATGLLRRLPSIEKNWEDTTWLTLVGRKMADGVPRRWLNTHSRRAVV